MFNLIYTPKILGVTCDNASANDAMIDALTTIMSDFPGRANRARCLAHIVNLVVKIILRQFDMSKKKKKVVPAGASGDAGGEEDENENADWDDEAEELVKELDKEEKEMDEGEGEEVNDAKNEALERDVKRMEEAMVEEIEEVSKIAKPVRQVLFKVRTFFYLGPWALLFFCFRSYLLSPI